MIAFLFLGWNLITKMDVSFSCNTLTLRSMQTVGVFTYDRQLTVIERTPLTNGVPAAATVAPPPSPPSPPPQFVVGGRLVGHLWRAPSSSSFCISLALFDCCVTAYSSLSLLSVMLSSGITTITVIVPINGVWCNDAMAYWHDLLVDSQFTEIDIIDIAWLGESTDIIL